MRYIFTESQIRHIIKEAKEHTNDEIVDFNEIDLQHEFNKLNELLFAGELYPIEMKWNKRRSAHGLVKASKNKRTNIITIASLEISQFLAITYKHFKDVLAHEMIHVYWLQKHVNAGHDHRFIREMNRINDMGLGFHVTLTADSSQFELSQGTKQKKKELTFLIIKVAGESGSRLAVMGYNLYKSSGYRVSEIYEHLTQKGKYTEVHCQFYISDNPELQRHRVQKSLSNLSYANITDEEADKFTADTKWLAGFVARSGDVKWDGDDFPNRQEKKPDWFNI
jgi:hypothetical protein